ncbi:glycosyltransferase [Microbacterium sp. NPDC016588]
MNIYVSVGTHEQAFQRLLNSVSEVIAQSDDHRWVVQFGVGSWSVVSDRVVRAVDYFTPDEVDSTLQWADFMVSQASPGNVFGALEAGVWPLVLGRRRGEREHVDDHQVRFAAALASMGLATDILDENRLSQVIASVANTSASDRAALIRMGMDSSAVRQRQFRSEAWAHIFGTKGARA